VFTQYGGESFFFFFFCYDGSNTSLLNTAYVKSFQDIEVDSKTQQYYCFYDVHLHERGF
jgi:hypothetical protein